MYKINHIYCCIFFTLIYFEFCESSVEPKYETKYMDATLDHFNFINNNTFKLRYLINDTFWKPNGPIFFYTGNEGDITTFALNTGFMWESAVEFHALIVFAEHRYYGNSLPFGNKSYTDPKYFGYLSSSQALADYVDIINLIKIQYNASKSKVIAFGGSYGGMLAAWMRMKYPSIITGALASSAPIWQFTDMTPCSTFNRIVSSVFAETKSGCDRFIKKTWKILDNIGSTDNGRSWLTSEFKTCKPIKTVEDVNNLKNWLIEVYGNLAMINYPYSANFLQPLPANPIKVVCSYFLRNNNQSDKNILQNLFKGISVYFNNTGTEKCLNLDKTDNLGDVAWGIQSCSEMVMPMCDDGNSDMFELQEWNINKISEDCYKKYKIYPIINLVKNLYGAKDIHWASNIIFSNGLLDPWSGGGVMYNVSNTAVAILIPGAAHHLDLRFSNPADPYEIVEVRNYYKFLFKIWLKFGYSDDKEVKIIY